MKTALNPGETLLREGAANLQRGIETVGGKLYLTDQRLIYEAHRFNVQSDAELIPLSRVRATALVWTKFLNLIPVFPNSLAVTLDDGVERRFVLYGREDWKTAIDGVVGTGRLG